MTAATANDRVNLVPLIDTMFFLILFFLMAMHFTPEEKAIASLLPTLGGATKTPATCILHDTVSIAVLPAGLQRNLQPSQYASLVEAQVHDGSFARRIALRVGGSEAIELDATALTRGASDASCLRELARAHAYIAAELASRERAGEARAAQPDVLIGACSQLPWSAALVALDGVRAYERAHGGRADGADALATARTVTFMAPPIRDAHGGSLGDELYQLANLR